MLSVDIAEIADIVAIFDIVDIFDIACLLMSQTSILVCDCETSANLKKKCQNC